MVPTHHHRHRLHLFPSASSPAVSVSNYFFFIRGFPSGGLAFALFQSKSELFSSSSF
jgi:hypothetical protein